MNILEIKIDNEQPAMITYRKKLFRMLIIYFNIIKIEKEDSFVNNYQSFFQNLVDTTRRCKFFFKFFLGIIFKIYDKKKLKIFFETELWHQGKMRLY